MAIRFVSVLVCVMFTGAYAVPSHAADLISCDSFESCPDGGAPVTNALLQLQARIEALEGQVTDLQAQLLNINGADHYIATDITKNIPGDFASLADALQWVSRSHIGSEAHVTFQLADGNYVFDSSLVMTHPDGDRIRILGNLGDPSLVTLKFNGAGGLLVEGSSLGLLDGVSLLGDEGELGSVPGSNGITATNGGYVGLGNKVVVSGFSGLGLSASSNGVILAEETKSQNNIYGGFQAADGGLIYAQGAHAESNSGPGFSAGTGGLIHAPQVVSTDNSHEGVIAYLMGQVQAPNANISTNGGAGAIATRSSLLVLDDATVTGNAGNGIDCGASFCTATSATVTNNGDFGFNVLWNGWFDVTDATSSGHTIESNLERNPSPIGAALLHDINASP